ncbi:MAG: hypothetical protein BECKG1743E_GA0114224_102855, partial [Candidatus Kentron sp. G]
PADVKCLGFLYLYVGRYPRNNASRNIQLRATMSAIRHPCLIVGRCPSNFEGRNSQVSLATRMPSSPRLIRPGL